MRECQYRKLRDDSWGILGPVSLVKPGATVTVWKRDGSTKAETIAEIASRPFDVDGVKCVYATITTRGKPRREQQGPEQRCAECGAPLRGRGRQCRDSSGLVAECCSRCAALSACDRSFA